MPRSSRAGRRVRVALAALPIAAVIAADVTVIVRDSGPVGSAAPSAAPRPSPTQTETTQPVVTPSLRRAAAIRKLLKARGDAIVHHDRSEWLATLDPKSRQFRAAQLNMFDNLHDVPIASWNYSFDPGDAQNHNRALRSYGDPVWAPADFALRYRLRGFDKEPTVLPQYPTFVHRHSGWYLASLDDFAKQGKRSARDLWDFGPVDVVRRPNVLVLGHPSSIATMDEVAAEATAAIPRVTAVWGDHWSEQAVILVPATQSELGEVVADNGNLDRIAAVATAEVNSVGRPHPVGNRIGINPANWSRLSVLGRRIVLTHELTHVATRGVTSSATPTWLSEGIADYVGYRDSGIPIDVVAQDVAADVQRGEVPRSLPTERQFDGSYPQLPRSYEEAWLACRLIVAHWSEQKLVAFYRRVGVANTTSHIAVSAAMQAILHTSLGKFTASWRDYLRSELG